MGNVILGLSAFYHDSAAAVLRDGCTTAAIQEERVSRIKFDSAFPSNAVSLALRHEGLAIADVERVAFFEDPVAKLDRILQTTSRAQLLPSLASSWDCKLHVREVLSQKTGYRGEVDFFNHHESHAAYAFFSANEERALVVVADGVGEWDTASVWLGEGASLSRLRNWRFPHSLGLFYAAVTSFLGFRPNSDEYKVMGLASFGRPTRVEALRHVLQETPAGFECAPKYFDYETKMYSPALGQLLGMPAREPGSDFMGPYADIAASAQALLQQALLQVIKQGCEAAGLTQPVVCMGGGVALNCVAVGWLRDGGHVRDVLVPPGADDAGSAIGAAMLGYRRLTGQRPAPLSTPYLGAQFSDNEIASFLDLLALNYERLDEGELVSTVCDAILAGEVIGWFQGRGEFGPRALGNRSILADPRPAAMRDRINAKVKHREGFRPFAPICLADRAGDWFHPALPSPYMTSVFRSLRPEVLQAVTHVDGTARLQTLSADSSSRTVALLSAFFERTGVPALLNTSFNVAEEPVVATPFDAFNTFRESQLDVLVLGNCVVRRDQQDPAVLQAGTYKYMSIARALAPLSRSTYFFS
jgi:carbamoyltransferase